ncbi:MAG: helix-turn-helix transcriptional regulator [Marinifilaceae bacterium]
MNVKKAIKIAMAQRDTNQKELSVSSGVSETTLSHTISGRSSPNAKTIAKIAEGLNMSYSELVKLGE